MLARKFFIDVQSRAFVTSGTSTFPLAAPVFFDEDVESIELYFMEPTGNDNAPYSYLDYSSNTVKFGVGTTTPAALAVTFSAVSTSVTTSVTTLVTGGSGSDEQQKISFSPKPAVGGWAIQLPARSVTVSSVSANFFTAADHGLYDGQSVALSAFSFTASSVANGSSYFVIRNSKDQFSLASTATSTTALTAEVTSGGGTVDLAAITTGQLSHNAQPEDVEVALANSGLTINNLSQLTVTGTAGSEYIITYGNGSANRDYGQATVVGSTLAGAPGLSANVNFNTVAINDLVTGGTTDATMEVEVSDGTRRHSYKNAATLSSDLIGSSSPITAIVNVTSGFDLSSQDGSTWHITVDNNGSLTASKV
jgi:hypothetical protein